MAHAQGEGELPSLIEPYGPGPVADNRELRIGGSATRVLQFGIDARTVSTMLAPG